MTRPTLDLTGKIINKIQFVSRSHQAKGGGYKWNCICYCGKEFKCIPYNVKSGTTRSCGCFDPYDIAGQTIENIEFISLSHITKRKTRVWNCKCHCGKLFKSRVTSIKNGNTKSCGCLANNILIDRNIKNSKWKSKDKRMYGVWCSMLSRCNKINHQAYKDYGGRGIKVCKEWENFDNYINWIIENLGPRPNDTYTLDRINNDGNYQPGNLRWADRSTQATNKRTRKYFNN